MKSLRSTCGSIDLNIPLSQTHRSTRQKINKISELNQTFEQTESADVYKMFHPTTTEYTLFTEAHENFSKIDLILNHRTC